MSEEYDAKTVEQLNRMIEVFQNLMPYFSKDTATKIEEITKKCCWYNRGSKKLSY